MMRYVQIVEQPYIVNTQMIRYVRVVEQPYIVYTQIKGEVFYKPLSRSCPSPACKFKVTIH